MRSVFYQSSVLTRAFWITLVRKKDYIRESILPIIIILFNWLIGILLLMIFSKPGYRFENPANNNMYYLKIYFQ